MNDSNLGICKLCDANVKTSGNTTNLKQHLKRKHPGIKIPNQKSKPCRSNTTTSTVVDDEEDDALFVESVVSSLYIII